MDLDGMTAGFADPVFDAQRVFHALMHALARPGEVRPVEGVANAPRMLDPIAGAVALALLDFEVTAHLDPDDAVAGRWLSFHTGVALTREPGQADYVFLADPARLEDLGPFKQGIETYPDRSATLVARVADLGSGRTYRLAGPGIADHQILRVTGLPAGFTAAMAANRARFPLGVDVVLCGPGRIVGLPRTVQVEEV